MKLTRILRTFVFYALMGTIIFGISSCKDDDESANLSYGTVTGIVLDEGDMPLPGVTVKISGVDQTVETDVDGKYTISNVSIESHFILFSKAGFRTISGTITSGSFNGEKIASSNIRMDIAMQIVGTIVDSRNNDAPLAGVTISVSTTEVTTSGEDGTYVLGNLGPDNYTVKFTKTGYATVTKKITTASFVNGEAVLDIKMGDPELLPGKTALDLLEADKWYYNEYRGGRNADAYPHWDWSTNYMSALSFAGAWEEQNEGTTLQIQNSAADRANPADLDLFDSYLYGSKKITDDNKILSLRVRTHSANEASPAYFGVQVIDLSSSQPVAVKIGDTKTYGSDNYADFDFNLSSYVGKEVIIAIGIYRKETGDYYKQLVLRAVRFADRKVEGWSWLPGNEVIDGWKLTQGMVRSTMVNTKTSFSGISKVSGNRDNYKDTYRSWRENSHIGAEWSFMPLNKDPEIFASEGFIIKTRGNGAIDTNVPESYFYTKFAVAAGKNKVAFKTRNFGSNYTFFKFTVVEEDGTVTYLNPTSNTAQEASAAANGCWKFKHGNGGASSPNDYAVFNYDLSPFNGKNVVVALSVHNGELNGDENKLVIYNIDLK